MAIIIDSPLWRWRGQHWCHLTTDRDFDELHEFASRAGLRRLAFQGDHYDVPAARQPDMIAAGATVVDSRELVRRLRRAGLRRRVGAGWDIRLRWSDGDTWSPPGDLGADLIATIGADLDRLARARPTDIIVLADDSTVGVGVTTRRPAPPLSQPPRRWIAHDDRGHHTDWFVPRHDRRRLDPR